jgi:hypothetical protein
VELLVQLEPQVQLVQALLVLLVFQGLLVLEVVLQVLVEFLVLLGLQEQLVLVFRASPGPRAQAEPLAL